MQVTVDLACSARELRWLWALRGALEGVLVAQASLTATAFLGFCSARCAEHAAQRDCLHEARIHLQSCCTPSDDGTGGVQDTGSLCVSPVCASM